MQFEPATFAKFATIGPGGADGTRRPRTQNRIRIRSSWTLFVTVAMSFK